MEGQQNQQKAPAARLPATAGLQQKVERKAFVDVLPKDLKVIISEVAASGMSQKFPWVEDSKSPENHYAVPKQIPRIHRKKFPPSGIVRHKRPRPNGRINHTNTLARMRPFHQGIIGSNTATATVAPPATATNQTNSSMPPTTTLLPTKLLQPQSQSMASGRRLGENGRKRAISRSGSGLPSGSEAEDLSQYECDSESTSVTSVSELSFDLGRGSRDHWSSGGGVVGLLKKAEVEQRLEESHLHVFVGQPKPRSLRDAFRIAVDLLLESYYQKRGYKPSPAEKRKHSTAIANEATITRTDRGPDGRSLSRQSSALSERELMMQESIISFDGGGKPITLSDDELQKLQKTSFCHRKEKILSFLDDPLSTDPVSRGQPLAQNREPPFTLQRIAEILDDPERYYTQTHKLCNSLEKLLLVSTTVTDFGGWYGGDEESIKSLMEDRETLRHRSSSVTKVVGREQQESPSSTKAVVHSNSIKSLTKSDVDEGDSGELYDAAARASLRAKFDHTGFDPLLAGAAKAIPDGRISPPLSPPLPNRATSPTIQIPLATGFFRSQNSPHGSPTSPDLRTPSAFSFHNAAAQSRLMQSPGTHSGNPGSLGSAFTSVPTLQPQQTNSNSGVSAHDADSVNASIAGGAEQIGRDAEMGSKSPASLSDADDSDMSFDDSASDRSDGSDAGQADGTTASLAAALNRAHQRLQQQNRVLSQLHGEGYMDRVGLSRHLPKNDANNSISDNSGRDEE